MSKYPYTWEARWLMVDILSKDVKIPVHMGGKVVDGGHVIGLIRSIASDMS